MELLEWNSMRGLGNLQDFSFNFEIQVINSFYITEVLG